jgi:spermidine synthase
MSKGMASEGQMWFANRHSPHILSLLRVQVIHVSRSAIQNIEVLESPIYGRILLLDGEMQLATGCDVHIHESLVHLALLTHENPQHVLVIGGGDGGACREILKHPVSQVSVVEIDPTVVRVAEEYFPETAAGFADQRVVLSYMDGAEFIKQSSALYEVIIMDLSDPVGPAASLFSHEFYCAAFQHLTPNGLLVTHAESPDSCPEAFYRIVSTLRAVFPIVRPFRVWIPCYMDLWGRVIASRHYDPLELSASQVAKRMEERQLQVNWLTGEMFSAVFHMFSRDVQANLSQDWSLVTLDAPITFVRP